MKRKKIFLISLMILMLGANISSAQLFEKLEITAPENATVGKEITITVTYNEERIGDAEVYINTNNVGKTDSNGEKKYTFPAAGVYTITATKTGYRMSNPHTIIIEKPLLIISLNPLIPKVGEEVTITVKADLLPIAGATVSLKEDVIGGVYSSIGFTDSNGQITYPFNKSSSFLLKAEKENYTTSVPKTVMVTDKELLEKVTVQGAVFSVPDSLESDFSNYKDLPLQMPYSSLLAVTDRFFLVFSDTKIEKGLATVEGLQSPSINWKGMEISVLRATNIQVEKEGVEVTIDEIKHDPDEYALDLVKINATIRQVSFLFDPRDGGNRIPVTVGRVVKDPVGSMDFRDLPEKIYKFERNRSREYLEQVLNLSDEGLEFFDFETKYWVDGNATINAIVLYTSVVKEFVAIVAGDEIRDLVIPVGERVLLYNVDTSLECVNVSIKEIKDDPDKYMGSVVTLYGSDIGVNVSVQETLKETQEIYLPVDVVLHGFISWCSPPPTVGEIKNGILLTMGASSHYQDSMVELVNDALKIIKYIGKIVSAKEVNESLNGTMLILYDTELVREIPVEEIVAEMKERIQEKLLTVKYILLRKNLSIVDIPVIPANKVTCVEIDQVDIENISVILRNRVEDAVVSVVKLEEKPSTISVNVNGEVYSYLEINAENISDEDVKNVTIEFKVNKSWIIEANVDEKSVRLSRYSNGSWTILSTSIVRETSTEIYYSAESPSLSIYAITGEKVEEKVGKGTPGFELVLAVVAIALILFWKRKRMS